MASISMSTKGDFRNLEKWLDGLARKEVLGLLNEFGKKGVDALAAATPLDTGLTASSWGYEITNQNGTWGIVWTNDNENQGFNIAVGLQYGHGTGTGGYVAAIDYINPAMAPVFKDIIERVWREMMQ